MRVFQMQTHLSVRISPPDQALVEMRTMRLQDVLALDRPPPHRYGFDKLNSRAPLLASPPFPPIANPRLRHTHWIKQIERLQENIAAHILAHADSAFPLRKARPLRTI